MAGALAVAGTVVAAPASADQAGALACALGANQPVAGANGTISAVGSRTDCGSSRVTLTVRIRKVRSGPIPDETVGTRTHQLFGNGNMTVIGDCDGNATYFTETLSSTGNKVRSGGVKLC